MADIFTGVLKHFDILRGDRGSSTSIPILGDNVSKITMDQTQDFRALQDQIRAALITTTRTTGQISSEDLGFQRSLNPEVGAALDEQSERVLGLVNALLKSAASISELSVPTLQDTDDVENNWRGVVDVVDALLEKTDTCLDEYTGVIKRKGPTAVEQVGLICTDFLSRSSQFYSNLQSPSSSRFLWAIHSAHRTLSSRSWPSMLNQTTMIIRHGSLFSPRNPTLFNLWKKVWACSQTISTNNSMNTLIFYHFSFFRRHRLSLRA